MKSIFLLLVFPLCLWSNEPQTLHIRYDLIELNHFHDDMGRLVFDQMIFRNWQRNGFRVMKWKLLKNCREECKEKQKAWDFAQALLPEDQRMPYVQKWVGHPLIPVFDRQTQQYKTFYFSDKSHNNLIKITSDQYIETWTQYDPETLDREFFPKELRPENW